MTQSNNYDIEHPIQSWWPNAYAEPISDAHQQAITKRLKDTDIFTGPVVNALLSITAYNHTHRLEHEYQNLLPLGLHLPVRKHYSGSTSESEQQRAYEHLAGKKETVGAYAIWFSGISHEAFVAQETKPEAQKFNRISLELGGKRQFGDWEATQGLDAMIQELPDQIVDLDDSARLVIYGKTKAEQIIHKRVQYVDDAPKTYTIYPRSDNPIIDMQTVMLRRRRPVMDLYMEGKSDVVVFKESIGLLVLNLMEPGLRKEFIADMNLSRKIAEKERNNDTRIRNSNATEIGGQLFEKAITAPYGDTQDVYAVSAHYIQGVGEKYAQFRNVT